MKIYEEIKRDLRAMDQNRSAMRLFGLLLGGLCVVFAAVIWALSDASGIPMKSVVLFSLGIISGLLAIALPDALKPINTVFLIVSLIIGWFMTRIVLILLFFGLFLPVGLILRILGKDSMRMKMESGADSYWILRPDEPFDPDRCRRLF